MSGSFSIITSVANTADALSQINDSRDGISILGRFLSPSSIFDTFDLVSNCFRASVGTNCRRALLSGFTIASVISLRRQLCLGLSLDEVDISSLLLVRVLRKKVRKAALCDDDALSLVLLRAMVLGDEGYLAKDDRFSLVFFRLLSGSGVIPLVSVVSESPVLVEGLWSAELPDVLSDRLGTADFC